MIYVHLEHRPLKYRIMDLTINRYSFGPRQCMGYLEVNGEYQCDTLEPKAIDWSKEKKRVGVTAIPEGRYRIKLTYSKTFKRTMPFLQDVPEFTGVMLHTGNVATKPDGTPGDSRGCILVGVTALEGVLEQSRLQFSKLYPLLEKAAKSGEEIWVTVQSNRKWEYSHLGVRPQGDKKTGKK